MPTSKQCSKCGELYDYGVPACPGCGYQGYKLVDVRALDPQPPAQIPLDAEPPTPAYPAVPGRALATAKQCSKCAEIIDLAAERCPSCGHREFVPIDEAGGQEEKPVGTGSSMEFGNGVWCVFARQYQVVFAAAVRAIAESGYRTTNMDSTKGLISFTTSVSLWSWGQAMRFSVVDRGDGSCAVCLDGRCRLMTQLIDWGEKSRISAKLFERLGDLLGP